MDYLLHKIATFLAKKSTGWSQVCQILVKFLGQFRTDCDAIRCSSEDIFKDSLVKNVRSKQSRCPLHLASNLPAFSANFFTITRLFSQSPADLRWSEELWTEILPEMKLESHLRLEIQSKLSHLGKYCLWIQLKSTFLEK